MKKKKQQNKNSYEIKNLAGFNEATILIYGIVGDYWDELDAKDIVQDINDIDADHITVHIYSDGGSVFAGLAIYNALKRHSADITVVIDSLAASIASVIAMAGKVIMPENAFMMIHNPWGINIGDASDMEKMAEFLAQIKKSLVGVYKNKTGLKEDKISDMIDEETWLSAKDAMELKFADEIEGVGDVQDFVKTEVFNKLTSFHNVPESLKAIVWDMDKKSSKVIIKPAADKADKSKNNKEKIMDLKELKEKYPELAKALMDEGAAAVKDELMSAGGKKERSRIQAVADCLMPGHEDLIKNLMYDGETSGGDAALKIVAAEKKVRESAQAQLKDDGVTPVEPVTPVEVTSPADEKDLTEDQFKADAKLSKEFDQDFAAYQAYAKALKDGHVRVLGK